MHKNSIDSDNRTLRINAIRWSAHPLSLLKLLIYVQRFQMSYHSLSQAVGKLNDGLESSALKRKMESRKLLITYQQSDSSFLVLYFAYMLCLL